MTTDECINELQNQNKELQNKLNRANTIVLILAKAMGDIVKVLDKTKNAITVATGLKG
jgi:hypothetical protein